VHPRGSSGPPAPHAQAPWGKDLARPWAEVLDWKPVEDLGPDFELHPPKAARPELAGIFEARGKGARRQEKRVGGCAAKVSSHLFQFDLDTPPGLEQAVHHDLL
jgi:hypothetical protein